MMNTLLVPFIIVAARSGGHIIPAIALAQQRDQSRPIVAITGSSPLERSILSRTTAVITHQTVPFTNGPIHWYEYPSAAAYFMWTIIRCIILFWQINPPVIFSTGGAISVPASIAARVLGIPFELYELNAAPGRATRQAARWASKIGAVFPNAVDALAPYKVMPISYPISYRRDQKISNDRARIALGIDQADYVILVLGGSQGSEQLNELVAQSISLLKNRFKGNRSIYILHQAGGGAQYYRAWYAKEGIKAVVEPFIKDLSVWYSAADFCIARAGAGTIHELLFFELRAILVPLIARSTDHQVDNARAIGARYPDQFECFFESAGSELLACRIASYQVGKAL